MAEYKKSKLNVGVTEKHRVLISIFLILIITIIAFLPSLKNEFTNWDDMGLVVENTAIRDLSWRNIRSIFTSSFISTYIPLTILSFSLEYHFFELNPLAYHTTNLILHLVNCVLVFCLIYILTCNSYVSLIAALLFGIHPLRVESVAWVTERKDVLYSVFFLGSIIFYLYYKKVQNLRNYYLSLFLFILSCMAKGVAVTLPFVLPVFDYFFKRKFNKKLLIEKIPFFGVALIFAAIAMIIQRQTQILQQESFFGLQNIFIACYGLVFYLTKTLLPFNLSAMYPYPEGNGALLPPIFLFSPIIVVAFAAFIVYSKKYTRRIIFGSLFFFITILPVLELITVAGDAIAADRYTYIPSIGLVFVVAIGIKWLYLRASGFKELVKAFLVVILVAATSIFSVLTWQRCKVWKNSFTLWSDVLEKYPNVPDAYNGRGLFYYDTKNYDKAISDFSQALIVDKNYLKAYYNRGNVYDAMGEYDRAISDFTRALELNPKYAKAYNNRGLTYGRIGEHQRALADFTKALKIDPNYVVAYNNRGLTYGRLAEHRRAVSDFTQALTIDPKYTKAYYNRAIAYYLLKEYNRAWGDVRRLEGLGYRIDPKFLDLLRKASIQ